MTLDELYKAHNEAYMNLMKVRADESRYPSKLAAAQVAWEAAYDALRDHPEFSYEKVRQMLRAAAPGERKVKR